MGYGLVLKKKDCVALALAQEQSGLLKNNILREQLAEVTQQLRETQQWLRETEHYEEEQWQASNRNFENLMEF